MKKNLTKLIIVAILISTLNPIANTSQAKNKTKKIICLSLKGNTLTYADAVWTYELGIEDENIVGRPKKHTMKLASKVSYSLLNADKMKNYKVNKKRFVKAIKSAEPELAKDHKIKYYWGMAAKVTLTGNKITKIQQLYQD